ncbi:recombinase family protein [Streptococcus agalactiae]|uniref:recombinase family protein n=1 Tax=Streptococcus agalactiae TaxID=1311 RepID=UPI00123D845F|nr:recombinase family protein [Streptococcus agalactiae]KAA8973619.1 recombinase family protein [Streptococcus agalactiae]KAA8975045.1 recombinase family protein [Streptococcus agalactiae]KAA9093204.1 recombinase family protein [Streptococcus agalactiae]KAA9096489.1 recombinase family protein [Streptococcus agalactiae]KAA9101452.1 recombinase family protein [Streptococcus agalactiae]
MVNKKVTTIPATISKFNLTPINEVKKRRVAGYARVSTDSEEQQTSYEAQVDYYTNYIKSKEDWEFVQVYTDEGISATNTKKRDGFKRMVKDALDGKIDLIVTKSVSRFARNTVDSLSTIRKLKEHGTEVFFEKENIWTFDSKGELLITIMSSLAQEESRSISENCTWGQRKRFADGKVTVPFERFLGYDRGEDGNLVVNPEQAKVVKKIYRLFLQGYSPFGIAKELTNEGILTPGGKKKWSARTVAAILSNEKYKGDALLQKSFTVDFLTKEKKKNEGEIPQYYVTGNHEAIIPPTTFDRVQRLLEQRKAGKNRISSVSIYSSKIKCGDCGSWYGSKTWHSTSKYRQKIWQCNHKFEEKCTTPHLTEEEIQKLFLQAVNKLVKNKKEIISTHKEMTKIIFDTSAFEKEKIELEEELNIVAEQVNDCINENARKVQNQDEYEIRYTSLVNRFNATKVRLDEIKQIIIEKQSKRDEVEDFIQELEKQELMTEFDKNVWLSMVDYLTVHHDGKVEFTFLDGSQVELNR